MKYLFIQTQAEYRGPGQRPYADFPFEPQSSYAVKGWLPINRSIKDGDFLKVSAERDGVRVEARFSISKNVPDGDNGSYEIRGGPFAGTGTFRNIRRDHSPDFSHFFVCHSDSPARGTMLRWRIGVDEFVDVATISGDD